MMQRKSLYKVLSGMRFFCFLSLLPFFSVAQNQPFDQAAPDVVVKNIAFYNHTVETLKEECIRQFPELRSTDVNLELIYQRSSQFGVHYYFVQTFQQIRVFDSYIKINVDKNGNVISMLHHLKNIGSGIPSSSLPKGEPEFWLQSGSQLIQVKRTEDCLTNVTGECLQRINNRMYFRSNADTPVTGMVFYPDPLSSQNIIYGYNGTYKHFNDSDYALLNDQRKEVSFPATLDSGVFRLKSDFAVIENFDLPNNTVATSLTPQFNYLRSKQGFKDVMAYYHVLRTRAYFMKLGFTNRLQYRIRIDSHSGSGDQSYFGLDDSTLNFGVGGVPDAEDADVICHEYTHALSFDIAPSPNMKTERRMVEEGTCDVTSAIMSYQITPFNWRYIYNFDGPLPVASGATPYWGGRNADNTKTYLDRIGDPYRDSDIWSACMLDIAQDIGHDTLMIILLNSIYLLTENSTVPQCAQAMITTDSMMFGAAHRFAMGIRFNERKFGNFPVGVQEQSVEDFVQVLNSTGFASGNSSAIVQVKESQPYSVTLRDASGKLIRRVDGIKGDYAIFPELLNTGVYFLTVSDEEHQAVFKLAKF